MVMQKRAKILKKMLSLFAIISQQVSKIMYILYQLYFCKIMEHLQAVCIENVSKWRDTVIKWFFRYSEIGNFYT